jgi:hypothetical protein
MYSPVPLVDVKDLKRGDVQIAVRNVDFTKHDKFITNLLEDILVLMTAIPYQLNGSFFGGHHIPS